MSRWQSTLAPWLCLPDDLYLCVKHDGLSQPKQLQLLAPYQLRTMLQASPLTNLPEHVFCMLLRWLDRKQNGILCLTCKQMLGLVSRQLVHLNMAGSITRKRGAAIKHRFPNVASLTYCQAAETTHYLACLTKLTSVSLSVATSADVYYLTVDLRPLEMLANLHSLSLEAVLLPRLDRSPECALAALTQLRSLQLTQCCTRDRQWEVPSFAYNLESEWPHDFRALPQLTKLQVADSVLWSTPGLIHLQKVRLILCPCTVSPECTLQSHFCISLRHRSA